MLNNKMNSLENRVIDYINDHLMGFSLFFILILAIIARLTMFNYVSGDAENFLIPWYDEIVEKGRIGAASYQIGNYNMTYQFIIILMSYLPIPPLYSYKIISCIFDFCLAFLIGNIIYVLTQKDVFRFLGTVVVLFNPVVILNSSCWAQCDSIYAFFCVLTIYLLMRGGTVLPFVAYGIALAFKLQAIFLLPFILIVWWCERRFTILQMLISPLSMVMLCLPNIIIGKRDLLDVINIYRDQTMTCRRISLNYPSFWNIIANTDDDSRSLMCFAICFTLVALFLILFFWINCNHQPIQKHMFFLAFLTTFTSVLFLPSMHERYGYLYEMIAIVLAFIHKKTIISCLILMVITMTTYSSYLFGHNIGGNYLLIISLINFGIYLYYLIIYLNICFQENT